MLSFKNYINESVDYYWEALVRDTSKLPLDKINLIEKPFNDDFEETKFDEYDAESDCENEFDDSDDGSDLSDYTSEPIYDDVDDDPDFENDYNVQNLDDWDKEHPEPEEDKFESEEEYNSAYEEWEKSRDNVEVDYNDAVRQWQRNMRGIISAAEESREESRQESRQESISDCVDEKRSEHEEEQERKKAEWEEENEGANGGYDVKFHVDTYPTLLGQQIGAKRKEFEVEITREKEFFGGKEIPNVFSIYFGGPESTSLTHDNSGGEARAIYNHLLASIVKAVETEKEHGREVNGFSFSAAEIPMHLMYDKFYRSYLKPAGYTRVNDSYLFMKNEYIERTDSYHKERIDKSNSEIEDNLKKIREGKSILKTLNSYIGKLVKINHNKIGILNSSYLNGSSRKIYVGFVCPTVNNFVTYDSEIYDNVELLKQGSSETEFIKEFLNQLKEDKNTSVVDNILRQLNITEVPKNRAKLISSLFNQVGIKEEISPPIHVPTPIAHTPVAYTPRVSHLPSRSQWVLDSLRTSPEIAAAET